MNSFMAYDDEVFFLLTGANVWQLTLSPQAF